MFEKVKEWSKECIDWEYKKIYKNVQKWRKTCIERTTTESN